MTIVFNCLMLLWFDSKEKFNFYVTIKSRFAYF